MKETVISAAIPRSSLPEYFDMDFTMPTSSAKTKSTMLSIPPHSSSCKIELLSHSHSHRHADIHQGHCTRYQTSKQRLSHQPPCGSVEKSPCQCSGKNNVEKFHSSSKKPLSWMPLSKMCCRSISDIYACTHKVYPLPQHMAFEHAQDHDHVLIPQNRKLAAKQYHSDEHKRTSYQKMDNIICEGRERPQIGCNMFVTKSILRRPTHQHQSSLTSNVPNLARSFSATDEAHSAVQAAISHCKRSLSVGSTLPC